MILTKRDFNLVWRVALHILDLLIEDFPKYLWSKTTRNGITCREKNNKKREVLANLYRSQPTGQFNYKKYKTAIFEQKHKLLTSFN